MAATWGNTDMRTGAAVAEEAGMSGRRVDVGQDADENENETWGWGVSRRTSAARRWRA